MVPAIFVHEVQVLCGRMNFSRVNKHYCFLLLLISSAGVHSFFFITSYANETTTEY